MGNKSRSTETYVYLCLSLDLLLAVDLPANQMLVHLQICQGPNTHNAWSWWPNGHPHGKAHWHLLGKTSMSYHIQCLGQGQSGACQKTVHKCYGIASCLISSHPINHASPILSNELSNTSVWLLWNSSLFNLLHFIIVWSCGHYYKVCQLLGITPHCWLNAKPSLHTAYTQSLSLFSQTIFLLSYFLICSFFHTLSSYLLISDSSDSRIIFHWRISGPYLIGW